MSIDKEEIFRDIILSISGIGSIRADCACGVTHFVNNGDFDENELQELHKKQTEDPEHYVCEWGDDSISIRRFCGRDYVVGCKCGWERRAAEFIWNDREAIIKTLKKIKYEMIKETLELEVLMEDTNDILTK